MKQICFTLSGMVLVTDASMEVEGFANHVRLPGGRIISVRPVIEMASGFDSDDHRDLSTTRQLRTIFTSNAIGACSIWTMKLDYKALTTAQVPRGHGSVFGEYPFLRKWCMIYVSYIIGGYMRALVDMSNAQVEALDDIARREGRSRASLIRTAIDDYLSRHHRTSVGDGFGLWGKYKEDGLAYQERVRNEW